MKFLNYILDWDYDKLHAFRASYLSMVKKPFRKLSAFVGVTGETFCVSIPLTTGRTGNFYIATHSNHELYQPKIDLSVMKQQLRALVQVQNFTNPRTEV